MNAILTVAVTIGIGAILGITEAVNYGTAAALTIGFIVLEFVAVYCWYFFSIKAQFQRHKPMIMLLSGAGLVAIGIVIAGLGVMTHHAVPLSLSGKPLKTHPADIGNKISAIDEARKLVDQDFNKARAGMYRAVGQWNKSVDDGADQFAADLRAAHSDLLSRYEDIRLAGEKYRYFDDIADALSNPPDKEALNNPVNRLINSMKTKDRGVITAFADELQKQLEPLGTWQGATDKKLIEIRRELSR